MQTVQVNASKRYDIKIGSGLINDCGKEIARVCPKAQKIAIVSDDKVYSLYGSILEKALSSIYEVVSFTFHNGENSKNAGTLITLIEFLAQNGLTRTDACVALGGGVVGDICGLAASVYLRGITFVQVPTTLLAMVDSSVGGKTAVNLTSGKNLMGSFYQPNLVLCDINLLKTLEEENLKDGYAEIIKYAFIADKKLYDFLLNKHINDDLEYVISTCVAIKSDIVNSDEYDTGLRQILNFGHTIGHAIEKCSNYSIHHGMAVGIGMAIISKGASKYAYCDEDIYSNVCELLDKYGLKSTTNLDADELFNATLSDKKRTGSFTTLAICDIIGNCNLVKVPSNDVLNIITEGIKG